MDLGAGWWDDVPSRHLPPHSAWASCRRADLVHRSPWAPLSRRSLLGGGRVLVLPLQVYNGDHRHQLARSLPSAGSRSCCWP